MRASRLHPNVHSAGNMTQGHPLINAMLILPGPLLTLGSWVGPLVGTDRSTLRCAGEWLLSIATRLVARCLGDQRSAVLDSFRNPTATR